MYKLADISAFERLCCHSGSVISVFNGDWTRQILREFHHDIKYYGVDKRTFPKDKLATDIGFCVGVALAGVRSLAKKELADVKETIAKECSDVIDVMKAKKMIRIGQPPKGQEDGEIINDDAEFRMMAQRQAEVAFNAYKSFSVH